MFAADTENYAPVTV